MSASAEDVPDLKRWCMEHALPFWATRGVDGQGGGFFERLFHDGSPDRQAIRRLRVQARQIYVYAHAAHAGWFPDGVRVALNGFDYMMAKGHAPDGAPGFVHLLNPDGSVNNPLRDTYDHMFVILGAAWLARVSGDAQVRNIVDATMAFVDEALTDAQGTLLEGFPASLPRRQNPNMHAFEAMLALHETLRWPGALARAQNIFSLMTDKFVDAETATIREFFNDDWSPRAGAEGNIVEPGHMAEWVWLMRRYAAMGGDIPADLPARLLSSALATADPETGMLFDEADRFGRLLKHTARTWPQTELAKAWLAQTEAGVPGAREKACAAVRMLHRLYLNGVPDGGWIDQRTADGHVISEHMPSSTFYHIFVAAFESDRVLGACTPAQRVA
ncbi:MAG: AGE family epimerase/isomerase [Beijerinckiaceae bacterium]